jgi:GNAT superfamily N-acetyltransferase
MHSRAAAGATFEPLTPDRWQDLERLFGPRGGCGGCWCMYWRLTREAFERGKGAGNKTAFQEIVAARPAPGMLAYQGAEPIGWCALAPRERYPRLMNARTLKPVDDAPAWAITCFFVARAHRRSGLSVGLLEAAAAYARSQGATMLEGYPVVPRSGAVPDAFAWTGVVRSFERAGFVEVASPSPSRRIMRRALAPPRARQGRTR